MFWLFLSKISKNILALIIRPLDIKAMLSYASENQALWNLKRYFCACIKLTSVQKPRESRRCGREEFGFSPLRNVVTAVLTSQLELCSKRSL